ncbi:hypothetical protein N825_06900 [Skermanella stibiiresistens SB22]|uniref:DUF305 domain-containing protein n=1 Tax=Skermanella stibiiresistens SB22 TaxID=1385369 RepID=W9H3V7_9PROT|nr:DUF305 domain-containing protein [Skermanella stibiiresistens]EWY39412.1 hypothetical protein N825_06900 [Skermanella stibiiresistens SB22]
MGISQVFRLSGGVALIVSTLAGAPVLARQDHMSHGAQPSGGAVAEAFKQANERMHKDMAIEPTGDADVDFARGMIPHHQGAIDMARIQIEHGKDPEMRRLAQEVISAQEREIAQLKDWLARNPPKP